MAKYGFVRPVRGETWHIEPIESAKRGPTPDNPYKPGAPVAVANNGKVASPETGSKPPASVAQSSGSSMVASSAEPTQSTSTETSSSYANSSAPASTITPIKVILVLLCSNKAVNWHQIK